MPVDKELVTEIDMAITSAAEPEETPAQDPDANAAGDVGEEREGGDGESSEENREGEPSDNENDSEEGSQVIKGGDGDEGGAGTGDALPNASGSEGVTKEVSGEADESKRDVQAKPTGISDEAVAYAFSAGISIQDARSFSTEKALINMADRMLEIRHAQEKAGESKVEPEKGVDPLAELPKLDPEVYEPAVIEMFDRLTAVMRTQQEQIKEFNGYREQTARDSQEANAQEVTKWFDSQVKSLGDDFADALGTGGHGTLPPGSSQLAKRDELADHAAVLLAGYQAHGKQIPPRDEIFGMAARFVLADEYKALHDGKLSADLAKRSGQHISRAGGKKTKRTQSPLEDTAALLDEKFFS